MSAKYNLIDSHVHLVSKDHIHYLGLDSEEHMLHRQHRLEEYFKYNTYEKFNKKGIVVIEMDVSSSIDEEGWSNPIEEFVYHSKLIDEGDFIKGVIPWAPIPLGKAQVEKYVEKLKSKSSSKAFNTVKGFRYVLQDKPPKTLLDPNFIDGLYYLDQNNYVFDIGIDLQDGGFYQFEESIELLSKFPNTKFIINHLTKPDFYLNQPNEEFNEWEYYMTKISSIGNNYMKLSGCFEKMPQNFVKEHNTRDLVQKISQWFKVILKLYGTKKIIFGSNWPMDNTNGDEYDSEGFNKWGEVVNMLLDDFQVDEDAKKDIFYNNCITLYNLTA